MGLGLIDIDAITREFEAAAFDSSQLPDACDRAARLLDAATFFLIQLDGEPPPLFGDTFSQALNQRYIKEEWWKRDDVTEAVEATRPRGVQFDYDLVSRDTQRRSALYNEFLPSLGLSSCAGWAFDLGGQHWAVTSWRGRKGDPFSLSDKPALQLVLPMAARATMLASKLRDARAFGMAEGLATAGHAAVIIDHNGRCSFATPAAGALFSQDFSVKDGRLWAADRVACQGLDRLHAIATGRLRGPPPNVKIPRQVGQRPVLALPVRVRGVGLDGLPGARLLVTLAPLGSRSPSRAALLQDVYKLTAAETRVIERLAEGHSPSTIGEQLFLRPSTIRQYVKSILAKTDTRRVSELLTLLASLPRSPV